MIINHRKFEVLVTTDEVLLGASQIVYADFVVYSIPAELV